MKQEIKIPTEQQTCRNFESRDISSYLFEMSRLPFDEMREPDKKSVKKMYNHLNGCELCTAVCLKLKGIYSSSDDYYDKFKESHFVTIRENEGVLESLSKKD